MTCPHCSTKSLRVIAEKIAIVAGVKEFKGISYCCPNCNAPLGISMDQLSLNTDLETRLAKLLHRV